MRGEPGVIEWLKADRQPPAIELAGRTLPTDKGPEAVAAELERWIR